MNNIFELKIYNSDKFRTPALTYQKSGVYCFAPAGTIEYKEYWDEEMRRCLDGYMAPDGDWISGYNYFYLNYCPIEVTVERKLKLTDGTEIIKKERVLDFPSFYDYDYYFFRSVEEAERQGKHMVVLKSRRKGYSYKCGSMMARNYYLIPNSKSYAYASDSQYLDKDGIITKAWSYLDFIDAKTAWGKKRDKIDRALHKRASYEIKDKLGNKIEQGYKSEIIGVSLGNDPDKVRGKAGKLILFEEAGKMPELKAAWEIARPSVETDGHAFGLMIAFGTGGSEDSDFGSLRDMFYNPDGYNIYGVENIWDEGNPTKKCGFFVPQYVNDTTTDDAGKRMFMDNDGNTYKIEALRRQAELREPILKNATSTEQIDRYVAEHCNTPQEACLETSGNLFPKKELQNHLSNIRTSESLQNFKQVGDLIYDTDGKIIWINTGIGDITTFPLQSRKEDEDKGKFSNKKGAIAIWEHPIENPPFGLYILGCDPYDHDTSTTDSLGSVFVFKRIESFDTFYDLPVAEYTGRPESSEDFYEIVRKLALYYNGKVLYENEKKGLFTYFKNKYCEHLLADQPDVKDVISNSKVNRNKGIHMVEPIKDWGETLIRDWLNEEYAPGKKNLTKIYSEPLLEELISFNRKRGNYDRVMAFMMVMIYRTELHNLHIKSSETVNRKKALFSFTLFKDL